MQGGDTAGGVRTNLCDVLLWTPSHRPAGVGQTAWTYLQQLCIDTECSLEDLLNVLDDRDEWRERERVRETRDDDDDDIFIRYLRFVTLSQQSWIVLSITMCHQQFN